MTSKGQNDKKKEEEKEKTEGGEKRKREEDSQEEDKQKKARTGSNAREPEDEEPRAGPSTSVTRRPPPSIGGYTVHKVLGRGGFGKVMLASVPGQNIYKAIKIINIRDNAEALERERRILMAVRDCPFMCHLSAAQKSPRLVFFIMEYLSGGSLESLIDRSGFLNIQTVRFYTAEIICGIQFLHGHGIAHRDIKPANIMLDEDGHIRIIDLGLAQDGLTTSSKICGRVGTYRYMAPEVHLDKPYTVAVDWWGLGIVVSKMSSGKFPFSNFNQMQEVFISITRKKPKIPSWLDADLKDLIANLLQKNPEKRLGVSSNIRDHPFFRTICWEELETRRAQPPSSE